MKVLGVKFCGGCNPQINRTIFYKNLIEHLPPNVQLDINGKQKPWDIGIMISGCPVACVDRQETRQLAKQWVVVSGELLDGFTVKESELVKVALQKIDKLTNIENRR